MDTTIHRLATAQPGPRKQLPGKLSAAPGLKADEFRPWRSDPLELMPRPEARAPEKKSNTKLWASLALTGIAVAGAAVGMAAPAAAQSVSVAVNQTSRGHRSGSVVQASSAQDIVNKFNASDQIYLVGSPLSQDQIRGLQQTLQEHPNIYVVVAEDAGRIEDFHGTVNHGIGGSFEFNSVVNPELGEKDGVVLFFYMNSSRGRQAYMRSEKLVDEAGVGESGFSPGRSLFETFKRNAAGGNLAGGVAAVSEVINDGVADHVRDTIEGARTSVSRAESAVPQARREAEEFANEFGAGNLQVSPSQWQRRVETARARLEAGDYAGAKELAEGVLAEISTTGSAMADFQRLRSQAYSAVAGAESALSGLRTENQNFIQRHGQGGFADLNVEGWQQTLDRARAEANRGNFTSARDLASSVSQEIHGVQSLMSAYSGSQQELVRMQSRLAALEARAGELEGVSVADAKESLQVFSDRLDSKDSGYLQARQNAERVLSSAEHRVNESEAAEARGRRNRNLALAGAAVGMLALGVVANRRAASKKKEAVGALEDARKEIATKTRELLEMMDTADFHNMSTYKGRMGEMAEELVDHVGDAITLVGGAEKFLETAEGLVNDESFWRHFSAGKSNRAIELLTDEDERLPFTLSENSRAVMEGSTKVRSWKAELLKRGASREFKKSLFETLVAMAEKRDDARGLVRKLALNTAYEQATAAGQAGRFEGYLDRLEGAEDELAKVDELGAEALGKQWKDENYDIEASLAAYSSRYWETEAEKGFACIDLVYDALGRLDYAAADAQLQKAKEFARSGASQVEAAITKAEDSFNKLVQEKRDEEEARRATRYSSSSSSWSSSGDDDDDGGWSWSSGGSSGSSDSSWDWGSSGGSSNDSWDSGSSGGGSNDSWDSGSSGGGW